jgi:hypothetical protein
VPVTARRSKAFYERLGEQVTNELVGWFNDVDATYRNGLKELNELNFARFDAKVEQRFAHYDVKWETRFVEFEAKFDKRFVDLEAKFEKRFAELEAKFDTRFAALEVRLEQSLAAQTRWMYLAWAVQIAAILSLWVKK